MASHPASSSAVPIQSNALTSYACTTRRKQQLTRTSTSLNETWANRKECITLSAELDGVLRVHDVQGGLGDRIGHRSGEPAPLDELGIAGSARDVDDFLLGSLFE